MFTIRYTPGYILKVGEVVTEDIINAIANPTIELEGTLAEQSLPDGAVKTLKIADVNVTEPKMANEAASERVLAPASVSADKLKPGAVDLPALSTRVRQNFRSDGTLQPSFDPMLQLAVYQTVP